jgi:hypothetical protein
VEKPPTVHLFVTLALSPHDQPGMAERRGVVIRFPLHRRKRVSLAVLGAYGQVCELERAQSRLFLACVAAWAVVVSVLQVSAMLAG